jgi:CRP-like cAMP-binding protein
MSLTNDRAHQMFPVLDRTQIETARRFSSGDTQRFAPGEVVSAVGERFAPARLVIEGEIDVVRRDGLEQEAAITTLGVGQFTGELSQLYGRPSIAGGRAGSLESMRPWRSRLSAADRQHSPTRESLRCSCPRLDRPSLTHTRANTPRCELRHRLRY